MSYTDEIIAGLRDGSVVPCLGPGVLRDVVDLESGEPLPTTNDDLIIAMNRGRPMAPKLMYEFSRAAMNIELKRGRSAVTRFLDDLYGKTTWSTPAWHSWLAGLHLPYIIDCNRDRGLTDEYSDREHLLVQGIARIGGGDHRYRLYRFAGTDYETLAPDAVPDPELPVLFKPLGCPVPESHYIASDADFVDYLTELMGGFGLPQFLKRRRAGKRYLLLGMNLDRDTERMLLNDLIIDAAEPAGWAQIAEPTPKAQKFCERKSISAAAIRLTELAENTIAPATDAANRSQRAS